MGEFFTKISVIVPSYNHAHYIAHTIESVIAQTFSDIELIIIDDCSTDGTLEVIEGLRARCEERFTNFIFVKKEKNSGVVDSMKKAVAMAQGDFIYPTASDDILKPNAVETLYNFIKDKDEYGLVGGDSELIDGNGTRIYWDEDRAAVYDVNHAIYKTFGEFLRKTRPDVDFFSEGYGSYKSFLRGNYIPNGFLWRAAAVKSVIDRLKDGFLEDWYLMLNLSKNYRFKYIDGVFYSYRWHANNAVKNLAKITKASYAVIKNEGGYCFVNGLWFVYLKNRLRYLLSFIKYNFIENK